MNRILEVQGLCKRYADFALKDVSFEVDEGEIVGFIGINGAGKTTTMKSILGTVLPEKGDVHIIELDAKRNERTVKEQIGVVLDDSFLPDQLTAKEINTILKDIYKNWDETYYWELVKRFDLPNDKRLRKFSSGMKMKMKIVAALSHHPKLLLLDEPTSGLDPLVRSDILDIFKDFVKGGETAVLFSTHIISDLEGIADRIVFIHQGKIVFTKAKSEFGNSGDIEALMLKYVKGGQEKCEN